MRKPSKEAIEYALEILEEETDKLLDHIYTYPKDPDAASDGGWNIARNNLKEVIDWLDEKPCGMCGEPGYYQLNPFSFEIEGDETEYLLCDKCANERRDDI